MANQYFGKYRAKVVDVKDPEKRGRIRVMCPKVLGEAKSAWCEPCIPVAYDNGGDFAIPKLNEFVWVEFEEGNSNKPIYTGGLWSTNKSPSSSYAVGSRLITWGKCKVTMTESSLTLSVGDCELTVSSKGVTVNAPTYVKGKEVAKLGDEVTCSTITGSGTITAIK